METFNQYFQTTKTFIKLSIILLGLIRALHQLNALGKLFIDSVFHHVFSRPAYAVSRRIHPITGQTEAGPEC